MSPDVIRMELLVRRLVLLAGDLHDQLVSGDWETAGATHTEYDEAFATFRHIVDAGTAIPANLMTDIRRLAAVHDENEQLAAQLRDTAGGERVRVRSFSRMAAYAPLTSNEPGFASRYVDGSA